MLCVLAVLGQPMTSAADDGCGISFYVRHHRADGTFVNLDPSGGSYTINEGDHVLIHLYASPSYYNCPTNNIQWIVNGIEEYHADANYFEREIHHTGTYEFIAMNWMWANYTWYITVIPTPISEIEPQPVLPGTLSGTGDDQGSSWMIMSDGYALLQWSSQSDAQLNIELVGMDGRSLFLRGLHTQVGQQSYRIDLPDVPSGIYVCSVSQGDRRKVWRTFVP